MRGHMMQFFNADNIARIVGQLAEEVRATLNAIAAADAAGPVSAANAERMTGGRATPAPNMPGVLITFEDACVLVYLHMHVHADSMEQTLHQPLPTYCEILRQLACMCRCCGRGDLLRWGGERGAGGRQRDGKGQRHACESCSVYAPVPRHPYRELTSCVTSARGPCWMASCIVGSVILHVTPGKYEMFC